MVESQAGEEDRGTQRVICWKACFVGKDNKRTLKI